MQQVQPLPKTGITEEFYSRQLSLYNLCVTDIDTAHPVFYTWTKNMAGRGSTEVSSALCHFLTNINLDGIKTIRLFSNGCAGQNKDKIVLHTFLKFLQDDTSLEKIVWIFPVRGHSYMPAERVFGRVEKLSRRHSEILLPEDYYEYQEIGEVRKLGVDWTVKNTKALSSLYSNLNKISEVKRIEISKNSSSGGPVQVRGLVYYRFYMNDPGESLLKRGVSVEKISGFHLAELPLSHVITSAKKKDIDNLLTAMVGDWRAEEKFHYYKDIVDGTTCPDEYQEEESTCECLEDDIGIHI